MSNIDYIYSAHTNTTTLNPMRNTATMIEIVHDGSTPSSLNLCEVHKQLGCCSTVIDTHLDRRYDRKLGEHFKHHFINTNKLIFHFTKVDKNIPAAKNILIGPLKSLSIS